MAPPQEEEVSDAAYSDIDDSSEVEFDEPIKNKHWTPATADKDSDEEELERLVLGNKAGFRENLFKHDDLLRNGLSAEDGLAGADAGMEDVDDMDLFMIDTGVSGAAKAKPSGAKKADGGDAPAWEDSDDERLTISLAGAT